MANLGPNNKRIAQLLRMLGSSGGERRNAFTALEGIMQREGISWSDIGNAIEHNKYTEEEMQESSANGAYSKAEMQEFAQAARAEGVEAGIKIGAARAQQNNGHLVLPSPSEMAAHCDQQFNHGRLKDSERDFIRKNYPLRRRLSPSELGFLSSIYIKTGGSTE